MRRLAPTLLVIFAWGCMRPLDPGPIACRFGRKEVAPQLQGERRELVVAVLGLEERIEALDAAAAEDLRDAQRQLGGERTPSSLDDLLLALDLELAAFAKSPACTVERRTEYAADDAAPIELPTVRCEGELAGRAARVSSIIDGQLRRFLARWPEYQGLKPEIAALVARGDEVRSRTAVAEPHDEVRCALEYLGTAQNTVEGRWGDRVKIEAFARGELRH